MELMINSVNDKYFTAFFIKWFNKYDKRQNFRFNRQLRYFHIPLKLAVEFLSKHYYAD